MLPDAVVELASYANLRGIDWEQLRSEGRGLMDSDDYIQVLEQRWEQFYAVAETLEITDAEWETTSAKEARDAWHEVLDSMSQSAQAMLNAIAAGDLSVAFDHAATVWTGSLKQLVIATSAVSHRNLTAHQDGTLYYAIETNQATVEEVEEQASSVARLWDAVVQLDQLNALKGLKKVEYGGTAGLGQAQQAAATLLRRSLPWVIGGVIVGAIVCALLVFLAYLSDQNAKIEKFCFDANGEPREDRPAWCDEPGQGMPNPLAIFLKPATDFAQTLATYMGIAVLLYAGIYAFPHIVTAWRRGRKSTA